MEKVVLNESMSAKMAPSQVKSSQSLFKHGKIHQEFKKLKIT